MKICIVGAGAMGSLIGHGCCKAQHNVSLVDRPERIAQLNSLGGLAAIDLDGRDSLVCPRIMTAEMALANMGPQDVVVLATKAYDLPSVAPLLSSLISPDTRIVTIQNGIPWWYLYGLNDCGEPRLRCLDPDGILETHINLSQVVGCVAYPAAVLDEQGRVRHVEGDLFALGELDGQIRPRTRELAQLFEEAGFRARALEDIRSEIWLKAWGALSINPVSALTRATMRDICQFPPTRALVTQMMQEAQTVGEALGVNFRHTIEKRIDNAALVGAHKTSMLQDVEAGRPLELDALMTAVLELADRTGQAAPTIQAVRACAALLSKSIQQELSAEG